MSDSHDSTPPRWSNWRVLGYAGLVILVYLAAQVAAIGMAFAWRGAADPAFDPDTAIQNLSGDNLTVILGVAFPAIVCLPLIRLLTARVESAPWYFLLGTRSDSRTLGKWCLVMIAFVLLTDLITRLLGRPVVPDDMIEMYRAAPLGMFVAAVLFAPVFEEILFRGLINGGFEASGTPPAAAAIITSLGWAALHAQYDVYGMAIVFLMGLLLSFARARAQSVLPCILMHAVNNMIALLETGASV